MNKVELEAMSKKELVTLALKCGIKRKAAVKSPKEGLVEALATLLEGKETPDFTKKEEDVVQDETAAAGDDDNFDAPVLSEPISVEVEGGDDDFVQAGGVAVEDDLADARADIEDARREEPGVAAPVKAARQQATDVISILCRQLRATSIQGRKIAAGKNLPGDVSQQEAWLALPKNQGKFAGAVFTLRGKDHKNKLYVVAAERNAAYRNDLLHVVTQLLPSSGHDYEIIG